MEPNETPMGPEELRPEPQKPKKKVLPYVVCCLATAVVVFALTFAGMTLLQSRQKSTSDDDYLAKVQEVVALLDARYVDGLDHSKLGDQLASAAVTATGDRWSYYLTAEELEAVTTAGTWAATAMGRQSPVMVAVQDKETLAELSRLNAAVMGTKNDPFYGAPTAVLVLGEKNNPNGVQDASLVMGNLLLAASGIGLGSCWINRAKETFETPEGKALLAKWGLDPEKYIGVGYCILGYPAPNGTRTPGPRKAGYVLHV